MLFSERSENMLKKINLLLAVLCALIFAGCCADKSYNVVLVGDVHFDHMKYHDMSKIKHLGIPADKYIYNKDGYFSWRNHSIWATVNKGGSVEKNTPLHKSAFSHSILLTSSLISLRFFGLGASSA